MGQCMSMVNGIGDEDERYQMQRKWDQGGGMRQGFPPYIAAAGQPSAAGYATTANVGMRGKERSAPPGAVGVPLNGDVRSSPKRAPRPVEGSGLAAAAGKAGLVGVSGIGATGVISVAGTNALGKSAFCVAGTAQTPGAGIAVEPANKAPFDPASGVTSGAVSPPVAFAAASDMAAPPLTGERAIPNWRRGELLGQGAFGSVYLGLDDDTGELVAVKQVSLRPSGSGAAHTGKVASHVRALEAEVTLLRRLCHPNIVRYLGTERTQDALHIFLEYVPGGSLAGLVRRFGSLPETVIKVYTRQILLGLAYLHANGIMHRDIKGANILVDNSGLVKLADFGASKSIEDLLTLESGFKSVRGTPYWMAPEVIKQSGYGRQADIWSVACTVIEMATGKPPWSQYESQVSAMFHIASSKGPPPIPQHLSADCKDFLYLCFNRNWKDRPQAAALLQHPFLAGIADRTRAPIPAPEAAPMPAGVPGALESSAIPAWRASEPVAVAAGVADAGGLRPAPVRVAALAGVTGTPFVGPSVLPPLREVDEARELTSGPSTERSSAGGEDIEPRHAGSEAGGRRSGSDGEGRRGGSDGEGRDGVPEAGGVPSRGAMTTEARAGSIGVPGVDERVTSSDAMRGEARLTLSGAGIVTSNGPTRDVPVSVRDPVSAPPRAAGPLQRAVRSRSEVLVPASSSVPSRSASGDRLAEASTASLVPRVASRAAALVPIEPAGSAESPRRRASGDEAGTSPGRRGESSPSRSPSPRRHAHTRSNSGASAGEPSPRATSAREQPTTIREPPAPLPRSSRSVSQLRDAAAGPPSPSRRMRLEARQAPASPPRREQGSASSTTSQRSSAAPSRAPRQPSGTAGSSRQHGGAVPLNGRQQIATVADVRQASAMTAAVRPAPGPVVPARQHSAITASRDVSGQTAAHAQPPARSRAPPPSSLRASMPLLPGQLWRGDGPASSSRARSSSNLAARSRSSRPYALDLASIAPVAEHDGPLSDEEGSDEDGPAASWVAHAVTPSSRGSHRRSGVREPGEPTSARSIADGRSAIDSAEECDFNPVEEPVWGDGWTRDVRLSTSVDAASHEGTSPVEEPGTVRAQPPTREHLVWTDEDGGIDALPWDIPGEHTSST